MPNKREMSAIGANSRTVSSITILRNKTCLCILTNISYTSALPFKWTCTHLLGLPAIHNRCQFTKPSQLFPTTMCSKSLHRQPWDQQCDLISRHLSMVALCHSLECHQVYLWHQLCRLTTQWCSSHLSLATPTKVVVECLHTWTGRRAYSLMLVCLPWTAQCTRTTR